MGEVQIVESERLGLTGLSKVEGFAVEGSEFVPKVPSRVPPEERVCHQIWRKGSQWATQGAAWGGKWLQLGRADLEK